MGFGPSKKLLAVAVDVVTRFPRQLIFDALYFLKNRSGFHFHMSKPSNGMQAVGKDELSPRCSDKCDDIAILPLLLGWRGCRLADGALSQARADAAGFFVLEAVLAVVVPTPPSIRSLRLLKAFSLVLKSSRLASAVAREAL